MEDIKLFTKSEKELETLIQAVRIYYDDKPMESSIEKYVMLIKNRKMTNDERNRTTKSRKN